MSKMHPCLQLYEILGLVFRYICEEVADGTDDTIEWPPKGSCTLAKLSRTCKTFSEPALDILWYHQPSLAPLIACLPKNAWGIVKRARFTSYKQTPRYLALGRDIHQADYDRIYHYSHRIRVLGFVDGDIPSLCRLDSQVLPTVLSRKPKPGPLLPNIRDLCIDAAEFEDLRTTSYPSLVVGTKLRKVHLTMAFVSNSNSDAARRKVIWENMRSSLKPCCAKLTELTIALDDIPANSIHLDTSDSLGQLYKAFTWLEKLDAPFVQLTHDVISHLATLVNLKVLICSVRPSELEMLDKKMSSPVPYFPKLEHLNIKTWSLAALTEFIQRPGFQNLSCFTIQRSGDDELWGLDPFFEVLRNHMTFPQLRSLSLHNSHRVLGRSQENVSRITKTTLIPILTRDISHLTIDLDGIVGIDGDTLRDLAKAWPELEMLCLVENTTESIPNITLADLALLACHCPKLERLALRFNALELDSVGDKAEHAIAQGALKHLNVCTSPVTNPEPIIKFLNQTFTNLSVLECGWDYSFGDEDMFTVTEAEYYSCWQFISRLYVLAKTFSSIPRPVLTPSQSAE